MLQIGMRSERGVLFVRLCGELTKRSCTKLYSELATFIRIMGIKNIVINLESLKYIDIYGEEALINCFHFCKGNSYVCTGDNDIIRQKEKFKILNHEFEVFDLINS